MNEFEISGYMAGEYELLSHIELNNGNVLHILYDRICQRKVLLKTGRTDLIENEARIMSRFSGNGIPQVYACFEQDGVSYLARQYIEGRSLRECIGSEGALSGSEITDIGIAVCGIISRLHEADPPIIHRDLKTDNVIITPDGEVYIIDFGISREHNDSASRDTCVMGTLSTAPPEQFGYGQTDERADVYSIGVMLREAAEGHDRKNRSSVSASLETVIRLCTEFDPEQRYRNAGEIKKALVKIKKGKARRTAFAAAGIGICAMILCLGLIFSSGRGSEDPAAEDNDVISYSLTDSQTDIPEKDVSDEGYYKFADMAIEKEVCRILGKGQGSITQNDLNTITEIKLIGNTYANNWNEIIIHGNNIQIGSGEIIKEYGQVTVLDDIADMPNLRTLILCNQNISDISPLEGLGIPNLALHGNNIVNIRPLGSCQELEQLYISSNPVEDLSPLSGHGSLKRINIGATNVTRLDDIAEIPTITGLEIYGCAYLNDFSPLGKMKNISFLSIFPASPGAVEEIRKLTTLTSLLVWSIEGIEDPKVFSELTNLSELLMDNCGLTSLDGIEAFPYLTNLHIRNNNITDLSPVLQNKELSYLAVTNTPIEDWSPLSGLEKLSFIQCSEMQSEEIAKELGDKTEGIAISVQTLQ